MNVKVRLFKYSKISLEQTKTDCITYKQKTMKKILSLMLVLCAFSTAVIAQDDAYTKEFYNYLNAGWGNTASQELGTDAYKAIFAALLGEIPDSPYKTTAEINSAAERLAKKYNEEQAKQDVAAIMAPNFQKHLSLKDLKEVNKTIRSDKKLFEIGNKLGKKEIITNMSAVISQSMMSSMMKISKGEKPDPILTDKEKQDKLYIAVEDYCKTCGVNEMMTSTLSQGLAAVSDNEEQKKMMTALFNYIVEEVPSAYYNSIKGRVSTEEVVYITNFYKSPLGQKLVAGTTESMRNPMALGQGVVTKIAEWLSFQQLN